MKSYVVCLVLLFPCSGFFATPLSAQQAEHLPDLVVPEVSDGDPAPGRRVKQYLPEYPGGGLYHLLYLPTDWKPGRKYPVIVEYAGNKYKTSLGTVEGSSLGYGISGGKRFIWVCMPYVSEDHQRNEVSWWGDRQATVDYCKTAVKQVCRQYGGDPDRVLIAGFSRGAIACNYIGLHGNEIAGLWCGFICHSHYDGVRQWSYAASDRDSAAVRLARLNGRPQFISHEHSVSETRAYLEKACPTGRFTFQSLPGWGHTDTWVLYDVPERQVLRDWLDRVVQEKVVDPVPTGQIISEGR